jgi:hypothetical protein
MGAVVLLLEEEAQLSVVNSLASSYPPNQGSLPLLDGEPE